MVFKVYSNSKNSTENLGKRLGRLFKGGEILGLTGDLGAGKTVFIQGLAKGLGIPDNQYVRSPTFTIINEYTGKIPLYHFDLYRLESTVEIEDIGIDEYFTSMGVSAIEWAEKLNELKPQKMLELSLHIKDENSRQLVFSCHDIYYKEVLKRFSNKKDLK